MYAVVGPVCMPVNNAVDILEACQESFLYSPGGAPPMNKPYTIAVDVKELFLGQQVRSRFPILASADGDYLLIRKNIKDRHTGQIAGMENQVDIGKGTSCDANKRVGRLR